MTTSQMSPHVPHTPPVEGAMTVGQVAEVFGVTVRTLHHYDEIGLLRPSRRTSAGYRLYSETDLRRLGTVVLYRRLGFPLEEVGALLDADGEGRIAHLRRQREVVMARTAEMATLVDAIDNAMEVEMGQQPATTEDLKALFGDGYDEEYQAEAQERWGESEQWAQSRERTASWTPAQWAEVKAETEAFESDLAAAVRDGVDPTSDAGEALSARHRAGVDRFYDCSRDFQVCLTDMYLEDEKFTRHYEELAPGTTQWLHDAVAADAARHDAG